MYVHTEQLLFPISKPINVFEVDTGNEDRAGISRSFMLSRDPARFNFRLEPSSSGFQDYV